MCCVLLPLLSDLTQYGQKVPLLERALLCTVTGSVYSTKPLYGS